MADRTTLQQRLHIFRCSEGGLSDRLIANKIDRSLQTVRKWRRRGTRLGRGALASQAIRVRLLEWRKAHPGWGHKTLLADLEASSCETSSCEALPSRSSIGRLLKVEGLAPTRCIHLYPPPRLIIAPPQLTSFGTWTPEATRTSKGSVTWPSSTSTTATAGRDCLAIRAPYLVHNPNPLRKTTRRFLG